MKTIRYWFKNKGYVQLTIKYMRNDTDIMNKIHERKNPYEIRYIEWRICKLISSEWLENYCKFIW